MNETIAIGSDHAGFAMKEALKVELAALGYTVHDFGTHSTDSVDYPDYAYPLAKAISDNKFQRGILICGSGQGVAISANRFPAVRAALCRDEDDVFVARAHNDTNVLALGARKTSIESAKLLIKNFLSTKFEGGRHQSRVSKMSNPGC